MKVLIVKLSSLGDVVHAMPAVQDIRAAHPDALIDWVVEPAFAPLVRRVSGVRRVIECSIRRWRRSWWSAATRAEWRAFKAQLQAEQDKLVLAEQKLTAKVEAFRTQKETIKAQYTAAEAQAKIGEAVSGISEDMADVGMAMDRAQNKVETMRARAGAIDELLESGALEDFTGGTGDAIDQELAKIGAGAQVDQELAAMKQALGVGGGTSAPAGEIPSGGTAS